MKKNNLIILGIILIILITGVMIRGSSSIAVGTDIQVEYTFPSKSLQTAISTEVDTDTNRLLLIDSLDTHISSWHPDAIVDSYKNGDNENVNATYEASFAGWKLKSINGTAVSGTYIYPDNDYIYFNDEPFKSFDGEITNLSFEALWGKTIYVRDPYNFVDIRNVFGYNVQGTTGDVLTAKIAWDTSTEYSSNTNSGADENNPVSTIDQAYELLKNTNGGKICIVNHVTLEGPQSAQSYAPGFSNASVTHYYDFGLNCNIPGVVTITGKNLGGGTTQENKANSGNTYVNSFLYVKNTRGAGVFPPNKTYNSLSLKIRFYAHTVLEDLNSIAYRENYNSAGARQTGDLYIYGTPNHYLLVENSFVGYKRSTSSTNLGLETTNWSHVTAGGYGGVSSGFSGSTHIVGALTATSTQNVYLNVRGTSWYSISGYSKSGTSSVNNIHINLETTAPSSFYAVNGGTVTAKEITVNTYENKTSSNFSITQNCNLTAENVVMALRGTGKANSTNIIATFYGGGYSTSSTGSISTINANLNYIIDGAKITNFYGGGNQVATLVKGNVNIKVKSGNVTSLFGGGLGGYIGLGSSKSNVDIEVSGGTIANLYGGGSGGFVTLYSSGSPTNLTDYTKVGQYFYSGSNKYYSTTKARYGSSNNANRYRDMVLEFKDYTVKDANSNPIATYKTILMEFIYPSGTDSQLNNYYRNYSAYTISDATINGDISVHLKNGANITGNVYGGGKNGAVNGNIVITMEPGAAVTNDIYGGGEGLNSTIVGTINYHSFKWTNQTGANIVDDVKFAALSDDASSIKSNAPAAGNYTRKFLTVEELENAYKQTEGTSSYTYLYSPTISQLGLINGDTTININGGSASNVYGGSNGQVASVSGDTHINVNGGTFTNIFCGGNAGTVGNTSLNFDGGTITGEVYGGGNVANINGDSTILVQSGTIPKLYGGGKSADVNGDVSIALDGGTLTEVYGGNNLSGETKQDITITVGTSETAPTINKLFGGGNLADHVGDVTITVDKLSGIMGFLFGGGHAADVGGGVSVTINNGEYDNIFGGGDLGKVSGNTYVSVGDKVNNPEITVNEVLYGGGRGTDDGSDASSIVTVEGNSEVWIVGMNTIVQNYGSTKLGKVNGDVNVIFDTYRQNNSTNPYVTMNGIDRATTVSLRNSYIALENWNEELQMKEGIKNITNLEVRSDSGLKMTASGRISGNFIGGGSFYLDSKVSLEIEGDLLNDPITNEPTKLVINPQATEEEDEVDTPFIIKGTPVYAYMIVHGNSNEDNIVCTDHRYLELMRYAPSSDGSVHYFYLENDVPISEQIIESFVNKADRNEWESEVSWGNTPKAIIFQDGIFTTDINLTYNFAIENDDTNSYQNIRRNLSIKESDVTGTQKSFPEGTAITMILGEDIENYQNNNTSGIKLYKYVVEEATNSISLSDFVNMEDSTEHYQEVTNLMTDENTIIQGHTSNSTIYYRSEKFRFVVDFTYCGDVLPIESYIFYMNITEDGEISDSLEPHAQNIIQLKNTRHYAISLNWGTENYIERDIVPIQVALNITASEAGNADRFLGLPVNARITLKDENGNTIAFPTGTKAYIGQQVATLEGGVFRLELIDELVAEAMHREMILNIDTTECQEYTILPTNYTIYVEIYVNDSSGTKMLEKDSIVISIVRPEGGTLVVDVVGSGNEQLTNLSGTQKTFQIRYFGDILNPYTTVELERKVGNEYQSIQFSGISEELIDNLQENQTKEINISFNSLSSGEYRIVFKLYGYEDVLYQTSGIYFEI